MATTYGELVQEILSWTNAPELEQAAPSFIQFAEARFNRALRTQHQIVRKRAMSDKQFVPLPSDWLEAKNIQANFSTPTRLRFVTLDEADELRTATYMDRVGCYSIAGLSLELLPTPSSDTEIEMIYWRTIPALTTTNTTNWLLARAPDLYLYASLVQASAYLEKDPRVPMWEAAAAKAIEELNAEAARSAVSGSGLARRRTFG